MQQAATKQMNRAGGGGCAGAKGLLTALLLTMASSVWGQQSTVALDKAKGQKQAALRILQVRVVGLTTYRPEDALPAAGLQTGQRVTTEDLNEAMNRLTGSGFFAAANYTYSQKPGGIDLRLQLAEALRTVPVRLEIPGHAGSQVWAKAKALHPLAEEKVPESLAAMELLQRWLEEAIASLQGSPMKLQRVPVEEGATTVSLTFRPEQLLEVTAVQVYGAQRSTGLRAQGALERMLVNREFVEPLARQAVEETVLSAMRQQGFLQAKLLRMVSQAAPADGETTQATEVAAQGNSALNPVQQIRGKVILQFFLEEGQAYQLRQVNYDAEDFAGALLPGGLGIDRLADGLAIRAAVAQLERHLQQQGFLAAQVEPRYVFDEAAGAAELTFVPRKGPLHVFAQLRILGLPPEQEAKARGRWSVPVGQRYAKGVAESYLQTVEEMVGRKGVVQVSALGKAGQRAEAKTAASPLQLLVELRFE